MRRTVKILVWVSAAFIFMSLLGFFAVPPLMKAVLVNKLSESLHRQVSIKQIRVNPYKLSVLVKGVAIRDTGKADMFVSLDELYVRASVSSIYKRAVIITDLKLTGPYVRVVRKEDKSYNFSDLMESEEKKPAPPPLAKDKKPLSFSVNNIIISGGRIDFLDGPMKAQHTIKEMNVAVPFISNIDHFVNIYVEPSFSANINGDLYELRGRTKPYAQPLESYLDVEIKHLDFTRYTAYLPPEVKIILRSGAMDLKSRISFIRPRDKAPSLSITGDVTLTDIALDDRDKHPLVRLPSTNIAISSLEPFLKSVRLSKVALKEPDIAVKREKNGSLNLTSIISEEEKPSKKGAPRKAPGPTKTVKADAGPDETFKVFVDEFVIDGGKVAFTDRTTPQPVTLLISDLNLKGERMSTVRENKGTLSLSLRLNKNGVISVNGPVSMNPVSANLSVDLKTIGITPFQAYFTNKVKINTTSGSVNTSGSVVVTDSDKTGLGVKFTGKILVANFVSVDKLEGNDFLKWKALSLSNVRAGFNPLFVNIGGVSLADFYARVAINPDGTLSLQKVIEEEGSTDEDEPVISPKTTPKGGQKSQSATAAAGGDAAPDISIGSITLQGGTLDFRDRFIRPAYSVNLTDIAGRIGGFSLKLDTRADVELRGKIDHHAPLEIVGKINPARNNLFTDLEVRFRNLDLSPMTPYSGKYMGYKIEKGSLSMDLKYLIEKRKLASQNGILIDQLTLGDKVDSPDAVKLPLKLAIALLRDTKGQIKLDVPVSGSLDDPEFSVFRIVIKVILNLIAKAATAPFALLGALFGGGEELSYVEFDYGSAQLSPTNEKKLDTLVKALGERPALKLDIEGHVDVDKDKDALRTYLFNKKIKARKLNDLIKKGVPAVPVDEIKIEPEEYQKYLTLAYKAEKFEKPRNVVGMAKSLTAPEMEKLILTHIVVNDDDLRTLAMKRAADLKDAILKSEKITPDRVFVMEPKTLSPEKKEKLRDNRVDFRLK